MTTRWYALAWRVTCLGGAAVGIMEVVA